MDEARLKEIESWRDHGVDGVAVNGLAWDIIDQFIAALRDAWRERDETVTRVYNGYDRIDAEKERADRAEAEVKRLLSQCQSANKHYDRLEDEVKILRTVREAAEAADKVLAGLEQANEDIIDEDNPPLLPGHWLEDIDAARVELRRALDACAKGPAR